jgi:hypothetical protein
MTDAETEATETAESEGTVMGDQPKPPERLSQSIEKLILNVKLLSTYAIQTGQLPSNVDVHTIYEACKAIDQKKSPTPELIKALVDYY